MKDIYAKVLSLRLFWLFGLFGVAALIGAQVPQANSQVADSFYGAHLRYSTASAGGDIAADGAQLTVYLDAFVTAGTKLKPVVQLSESFTGTPLYDIELALIKTAETKQGIQCAGGTMPILEKQVYSATVNIKMMAGGYTLQWKQCCLEPLFANADILPNEGITLSAKVPDPMEMLNSSGGIQLDSYPMICAGQTNEVILGTTDENNDKLKVKLSAVSSFSSDSQSSQLKLREGFTWQNPFGSGTVQFNEAGNLEVNQVAKGNYLIGLEIQETRENKEIGSTQWVLRITVN